MFSRGNWAVFGLASEDWKPFIDFLQSDKLSDTLQKAVKDVGHGETSRGINPPRLPRLDDDETDQELSASDFVLSGRRLGFWFCLNTWEDLQDLASRKEALAYERFGAPFRLLRAAAKKTVNEAAKAWDSGVKRQQIAVLLDFDSGMGFAETAKSDLLIPLFQWLANVGVDPGRIEWINPGTAARLLQAASGSGVLLDKYVARAKEVAQKGKAESEQDARLEWMLRNFFRTLNGRDQDISLSTPAKIRIADGLQPVAASSPHVAATLLNSASKTTTLSAKVVLHQNDDNPEPSQAKTGKKGEKRFSPSRAELYHIDLSPDMYGKDIDVALMRGFDAPFERSLLRKNEPGAITEFWLGWLMALVNGFTAIATAVTAEFDTINDTEGTK